MSVLRQHPCRFCFAFGVLAVTILAVLWATGFFQSAYVIDIFPGEDIQDALEAIARRPGKGIVRVHTGTYRPERPGQALVFFNARHDGITLEAFGDVILTAANPDIADPKAAGYPAVVNHVVYFGDGISRATTLRGFKITGANGFISGPPDLMIVKTPDDLEKSRTHRWRVSSPIDSNAPIKTHYFYADGGGILIYGRSYPTIEAVEVYDNYASVCSGGVSVQHPPGPFRESVLFKDCVFRDNRAAVSGSGVDLFTSNGWAVFENCLFVGNLSNTEIDANGGPGYGALTVFPGCRATVSRCTFTGNRNGVDDRSTTSTYRDTIFWQNNQSGGASPPGRYELVTRSPQGVTGCMIGGGEEADPLRNINRSANMFGAPDPEFDADFRPRHPAYQRAGYRPRARSQVKSITRAPAPANDKPTMGSEPGPFRFVDIRPDSGVDFVHVSGMTPDKLFPTANGSGLALFDYDGDGKLDLYFATGNVLPLAAAPAASNRLYKNLGGGKFRDETEQSGLGFRGYCHGITIGDIDNDRDSDVFLSNYGGDALYVNQGNGTFVEIGQAAGIRRPGTWSSSAAFLDYDGDGDLDLYVSRYGDWQYPRDDQFCGDSARKIRRYCPPATLTSVKHTLFRNNGDRTFTDVTDSAGLGRSDGHGFAAVAADLDGDGDPDLYVANDRDPHFLYLNNGNGTFRDVSEDSGAAFDIEGRAQAGMGVDAEDIDGDGRPELFVTNFWNEYNTLYRNLGGGNFLDVTAVFGLAVDSLPWIGWGCALADLDNDGWPDCVVANAEIDDNAESAGKPLSYVQPPLVHLNQSGRRFRLANRGAGAYFEGRHLGHGLAVGDLDDDGDLDLVINHKDGPPAILRNDTPSANHWIRLLLVGTRSSCEAIGARVEVEAGGRVVHRLKKSGQSLMSSHDPRILVGVGTAETVERVVVRWPSGAVSTLERPALQQTHQVVEPRTVR
jgi:hypothetical protein